MELSSRLAGCLLLLVLSPIPSLCQQSTSDTGTEKKTTETSVDVLNGNHPEQQDKRIFGIIPNHRTSPSLKEYTPLTAQEKFRLAAADGFDRGTFVLAASFAVEAQLTDSSPSFGQGMRGYARYLGTAYADYAVGDWMTEAIFPSLLHQDPRYFRRGIGSGWSRLGYAVGQIFWTHTDSGGTQFNFSEIAGNSTAVALSMTYYPDNRNFSDAIVKLANQIGVDMAGNILKEFWPDLSRKFSHRHQSTTP